MGGKKRVLTPLVDTARRLKPRPWQAQGHGADLQEDVPQDNEPRYPGGRKLHLRSEDEQIADFEEEKREIRERLTQISASDGKREATPEDLVGLEWETIDYRRASNRTGYQHTWSAEDEYTDLSDQCFAQEELVLYALRKDNVAKHLRAAITEARKYKPYQPTLDLFDLVELLVSELVIADRNIKPRERLWSFLLERDSAQEKEWPFDDRKSYKWWRIKDWIPTPHGEGHPMSVLAKDIAGVSPKNLGARLREAKSRWKTTGTLGEYIEATQFGIVASDILRRSFTKKKK